MENRNEPLSRGFDRLQQLLLAMNAGDELRCSEAARASGLAEPLCKTVLEKLASAGLMSHEPDGRFVRRTMADPVV